MLSFKLLSY